MKPPLKLKLAVFCLCLVASTVASASDANPSATLAKTLVELPGFRQALGVSVGSSVRSGVAADLARMLIEQEQAFWDILETEFPSAIKEEFTLEELIHLNRQFNEDPAQTWSEHHEVISSIFQELANGDTGVHAYLRRFGCQVGFISGPIGTAFEQARAAGKTPEITPEMGQHLRPIMGATASTCDCLFENVAKEYLDDPTWVAEKNEDFKELMVSGQCADPFAQLAGGGQK